jgi:hypothetical protein
MQSLGSADRFPPVHHKLILNLGASPRCRSCAIDSLRLPGHRVIAPSLFYGHSGSNQSGRITPNDLQHRKLPLRAHQASAQSLRESRPAPAMHPIWLALSSVCIAALLAFAPASGCRACSVPGRRESGVIPHDIESRVFLESDLCQPGGTHHHKVVSWRRKA